MYHVKGKDGGEGRHGEDRKEMTGQKGVQTGQKEMDHKRSKQGREDQARAQNTAHTGEHRQQHQ